MVTTPLSFQFENLRHRWGWLLVLGLLMAVLGTIALVITPAATLGTVLALGWLLAISGVFEIIQAFRVRRWGGFFLHLLGGLLGIFVGLLIVTHPVAGALGYTLLLASFFTVIGIFRLVTALALKFPHWGWAAFDGVITLVLGIVVWAEWPWSGFWFLGLAVGISLILRGWSYVMFALAIHNVRLPDRVRQAA